MVATLVGQVDVVESVVADPLSAVLLGLGAVLTGFALGLFGYLSLRGVLAAILPERGREPPRRAR